MKRFIKYREGIVRTYLTLAAAVAFGLYGGPAGAEWKPAKSIKLIIGFGAGGTTDVVGRLVAKKIEDQKGWKIIVENKAGASGTLAVQEIKDAAPDGHTLGIVSTSLFALMPALTPPTRYKAEDLDYLGTIGTIEYALVVGKDAPYDDLAGLAAFAKKSGAVTFSATGKVLELTMERLAQHFDFKFVSGPTSGSAQSLQLVLGGHAHATISGGVHVPYIETGKAKSIASLSNVRADYAPNARTLQEQGAGEVSVGEYFTVFSPKNLPAEAKAALAAALDAAVNSPEVTSHLAKTYNRKVNLGPEGAQAEVMRQAKLWRDWLAQAKKTQ
jgi:tripartite-type tricarboxylate transporter receptor subunit TctC